MFDLLPESNVRDENEENFFYSMTMRKKEDSSIHRTKTKYLTMRQNLSSDNELVLQFGSIFLISDEQDNEN